MKRFEWDDGKNQELRAKRGVSFEEVLLYITNGHLVDVVPHPNPKSYAHQKMFIVAIDEYAYLVPFVEDNEVIFLKTIIPSRKATRKYLKR